MEPLRKVRTDEIVRTASDEFNKQTDSRHYYNEVHFSFHNHREIMDALDSGRAVDLANVPKRKRKSVMIVGSGPTLNEVLPLVKDWEGDIICSTSQALTLMAWGHTPEHIVALDPDSHSLELEPLEVWEGKETILHTHPGVTPELVQNWKGNLSLFRKLQPQTAFYAGEQAIGYSTLGPIRDGRYWGNEAPLSITAQVPMLACVLPAQMAVAKHIGYSQMVLVGADFSFPGDVQRFTAKTWKDGQWIECPLLSLDDYYKQELAGADPMLETELDGLKSTAMQIFYSHQAVIAWRVIEASVINASHAGLLRMFPYVPIEEIVRRGNKGVKGFTLPQIRKVAEEHLARQNIYFLYIGNGVMPHEFKDPLHDIPLILPQIQAQLEAQGQGIVIDVEANMKRIKRLFKKMMDGPNPPIDKPKEKGV